jgi:hypothetical protein
MYGFHREKNTELSNRRPTKEDIRSHTRMRNGSMRITFRIGLIEHFGDDDDSEEENSGYVDSEDRVYENERY